MKPIVKNSLAIILGWFAGSVVNMGIIKMSHSIMPIEGVDVNDMVAFAEIMPTLSPKYFVFPFLAHALGTLVGSIIAGVIAANNKMKFSLIIGGLFLLGGIAINYMLPGPIWFAVADILVAYIPMAWIGGKIALKLSKTN